jgi:hypothetical protein
MELGLSIALMVVVVGTLAAWAIRTDRRRRAETKQGT